MTQNATLTHGFNSSEARHLIRQWLVDSLPSSGQACLENNYRRMNFPLSSQREQSTGRGHPAPCCDPQVGGSEIAGRDALNAGGPVLVAELADNRG